MISVGKKCFLAKVLLPEPEAPIRTTRDNSGNVNLSLILVKPSTHGKPPFVWGLRALHLLRRPEEMKRRSCAPTQRASPSPEIRNGSTRNGGPCDETTLLAWSRISRCILGLAWS